jgi:hypothetical protein
MLLYANTRIAKTGTMRIAKATLNRLWLVSTLLALAVYAVLASLDARLKALSGVGTFDLQSLASGIQYDAAFHAWGVRGYLARAGFNLGFDYLFIPLYGAAMFYSGVILVEAFASTQSRLRRILSLAALAPVVAAGLDVIENALQLVMLTGGPSDALAQAAHILSTAKLAGLLVGLLLLIGAVVVRLKARGRAQA